MDWLTFKFCVLIWVLCVSKSQSQSRDSTSISNQLRSACVEGQPVVPPDECNTCICFSGLVYCTNLPCPEKECINGMELPQPDECNKCICRRGKVTCTNMICIPAPHCTENQLYPAQNKCNACMCKDGFITCTSNVCAEEPELVTTTTTTTRKPKKKKKCVEGSPLPGPSSCLDCICQNGSRRCKYICKPTVESRFQGPECYPGQHITKPDDCNNCICFEGQIHCTHLPCRMDTREGPECSNDQPVFSPDECNECYCFEGRLECSDLVCIRGSKCVDGEEIAKPDSCNSCKCVDGRILCTNHVCPVLIPRNALLPGTSTKDVIPLEKCQEGDYIPPPPPPNDCNTCYCMHNHIVCTKISCEDRSPEFKGRLKEIKDEKTNLEKFDKKIPVEPFINVLYSNTDKIPHKLIHSHTYNGFHQEIKVHAGHLPKDTNKLLKVLATSLDNAALASISQRLASNSGSSDHDSKKPFDHLVNQTNQLGEGNVLSAQTSKLVTSGSQSNETIVVFPQTKPFDDQDSQSVLPLESKHDTTWKTVSAPATLVYNNGVQIMPRHSQEENGNKYDYDGSMPIDQNLIRDPSRFTSPGQLHVLPTKPTRNTIDTPGIQTQSIYPTLHPKPPNINDGKIMYAPFSQDNKQIKPSFVANRDELPHLRPFPPTQPGPNPMFNYTSSTSVIRPGQYVLNPHNNVGQQIPSQTQFIPNPSNFYPNKGTPQQFQSKPKQIPSLHINNYNNKDVLLQPLFPKKPNHSVVSANQYKPLHLTNTQFKPYPNNNHLNPPLINLPYQKNRIDNEGTKEISSHPQFEPISPVHSDILNPLQNKVQAKHTQPNSPQSQFIPNPSIYYKNEYQAPKIIEEDIHRDLLTPSLISYNHTEEFDPPHISPQSGYEKPTPKVRNKTNKYNTPHSHYEKHTSITYVSDYDSNHPDDPTLVNHDLNDPHNGPLNYVIEHYLSDEDSPELDLSKKVDYYLNLPYLQQDQNKAHPKLIQYYLTSPGQRQNETLKVHPKMAGINKYDPHDSWSITNNQFDEYPNSPSKTKQTDIKTNQNPNIFAIYLHKASKPQLVVPQDNSEKEGLNDLGSDKVSQSPSSSAEDPIHPKSNDHLPPPSQTGSPQNLQTPGVLDDQGSNNGFQYSHNVYEDPRQFKPLQKLSPPKLQTPQNNQLPGMFDDRGSADGFQYPSNFAEDLTPPNDKLNKSPRFDPYKLMLNPQQPEDNQNIPPFPQFGPSQNQHKPGDNRGVKDGLKYASNANEVHRQPKFFHDLPLYPPGPTNKQTPGTFDERGSPDGFRYPSYSADNPINSTGNLPNLSLNQFGPGNRGSADGFHYPSNFPDVSLIPKDKLNALSIKYGPTQNQHLPGMFDDRGSAGGLQNPPNSIENSLFQKGNNQNLPDPKLDPKQNQRLPGAFDGRGSTDGLHYPTNSTKNPFQPKYNLYKSSNSPLTQKQDLPGLFDDRGSADGLQYLSNSSKTPFNPNKPGNFLFRPSQKHNIPGVFDNRGISDGIQYPTNSAEGPKQSKENIQKSPILPFGPILNKPTKGTFGDRGATGGIQYPFNSAEDTKYPKVEIPQSQLSPTKNLPGIFDERGSADAVQYPSNSLENPTHPKDNQKKSPQLQFQPSHNQYPPGVFDDRGSPNGFHNTSNSAENTTRPKVGIQNFPRPQFGPTQNQHMPGVFDDRGSADGFQYPSQSDENSLQPKDNQQDPSHPQFGPNQNQQMPGKFDDRGSTDDSQYPQYFAENPLQPKGNQQDPSHPQFGPNQNQHMPGVFDDRGSFDGFQYPSQSAENPLQPQGNQQNPPRPQLGPNQDQHIPGVLDDLGSANEFQYLSNSAGNPKYSKENIYKQPKSLFSPTQNQHNPASPKQNKPYSPFGPTQNQNLPGMFDERGSTDGVQYPSFSAENPLQPKGNQQNPSHPQLGPNQNQQNPGVLNDRGSADSFQYPQYFAENSLQPKGKKQDPSHPQFGPNQNQHMPGVFDDRGSADGFQYPSQSDENSLQPQGNQQNLSRPQLGPNQDQHIPGVLDDLGSANEFQYLSNSAGNPQYSKENIYKQPKSLFSPTQNQHNPASPKQNKPYSPFGPTQNQNLPGMFDERGSTDGVQYPSQSAGNPLQPQGNQQNPPHPQLGPNQNKHLPGVVDDRGSADGFQYPSYSVENPLQSKGNQQNPSHPQLGPNQNQQNPGVLNDRGSADSFQYPQYFAENPLQPKGNKQDPSHPQFGPNQNQHMPGVFDDRGSADGFQYPSQSDENSLQPQGNQQNPSYFAENPLQLKGNQQDPSHPQFGPNQNQHMPGVFVDRGFQYPSQSAKNPLQPKDNQQDPSHPQFGPNQNQQMPGKFDDRGSTDGFQYPQYFAENPLQPKGNQQDPSHPQFGPNQNQHLPGVFDNRGAADGFQYPSQSAKNPLQPKGNQQDPSHPQFGPNQNQQMPGKFDDRGSAAGFQYPSNSAEDPKYPNDNPDATPESNLKLSQNQSKSSSLDQNPQYIPKNDNDKTENQSTSDNYNNNNPVRPWMYLDHDQYKPSSIDNLLNGVHNIPWSLSKDSDEAVNTVSSTHLPRFEPDYDQYKPSSFDNLFNGIHHVPRPVSNQDKNSFGSNAVDTAPQPVFKPEQDQFENTEVSDEDDDLLQIQKDNSTDLINSDSMQNIPYHKIKPDSVPDSLLPTDDGKTPDYYDQLYTLFIALKKLSEPSNDDSGLGSMDQLELLPILFPDIADILNYNPAQDQDDEAPVEKQVIQRIFPINKLKYKLKQLPNNDNRILNWLKSKLNKLTATKDNTTETKTDIDLSKIFKLLSKLMPNKIDQSTDNIPFNGFDPEIVDKIKNDFKKDTQTATSAPSTDETTDDVDNRFNSDPILLEETQQQDTKQYPEVHIIIHQPDDEDDADLPPYIEADGGPSIVTDTGSEEIYAPLFTNMFHPRFRHRPKDQKDECGDGTQWISNCHSCSCYLGQTVCMRMQDCELRPFGEPMTCKPYSHFKMGCYACECNGDGVAECDASDCSKEPKGKSKVSGPHQLGLPIYHEFYDNKKTKEILEYYKYYQKLPKECPSQNSQTEYPTCERGTSWISSCHKCECNESGKHKCTKINDCVMDFNSYGKPGKCKPNSKFYPKTNSMPCVECLCNDEGISYCPEADLKKH